MTQQPAPTLKELQRQIAELTLINERKQNQLLTDLTSLAESVTRLSTQAAADRERHNQLAAEVISDRTEYRELFNQLLDRLGDRHSSNGSSEGSP